MILINITLAILRAVPVEHVQYPHSSNLNPIVILQHFIKDNVLPNLPVLHLPI